MEVKEYCGLCGKDGFVKFRDGFYIFLCFQGFEDSVGYVVDM